MIFKQKNEYKRYKDIEKKKEAFIYGYVMGIKACLRSLTNIEKSALQDLKILELARTEGKEIERKQQEAKKNE